MQIEIKVPSVGESITEVEVGQWLKSEGDAVKKDENLVVIESEKSTLELPSPADGVLGKILKKKGETAKIGDLLGTIEEGGTGGQPAATPETKPDPAKSEPAKEAPRSEAPKPEAAKNSGDSAPRVMPAAARLIAEQGLKVGEIEGTGPGGRILKEDVLKQLEAGKDKSAPASEHIPTTAAPVKEPASSAPAASSPKMADLATAIRQEQVVPMTRLRKTLADRLVQAQQTAALLTTFNEVDMTEVMNLRRSYQESFVQKYGVKLGFMSFFVKAVIDGLRQLPQINAEIRGTDVIYRNYYDIGVAVGGGRGLVVPVLRNAERLSFAQIESTINDFGKRAKENKLKLDELQGGTFTISNGGVYGSLLSTPIVNPPQSGILGMHAIQDRPIAREGQVVIRPMMYLALTYDHRIVDGREAVTFLKRIKEVIENPTRILLEV